jgi:hypothetical protein
MKIFNTLALALAILLAAATANAADTTVDLSSVANTTWCGEEDHLINCSTFPTGSQTFNDIPFAIATENNAWFADQAADGGSGTVSVIIPVNVANVKTVYTLMNTMWGSKTKGLVSITFTGTGGATWTYEPIEGVDMRDYNNGSYVNTMDCRLPSGLDRTGTVSGWRNTTQQRLDMQIFELPASFAGQTLKSVTITDSGNYEEQRSFISAMTVSTDAP